MKQAIEMIRQAIKKNSSDSRAMRKHIHETKGMDRWQWWAEKRTLGEGTRYWLMALACLRGRSYVQIEAKCGVGNEASASNLLTYILAALKDNPSATEWTRERVRDWLKRPSANVMVEAAA